MPHPSTFNLFSVKGINSYKRQSKCEILPSKLWPLIRIRTSFRSDEEWRLFYCDSTLDRRVIQDFDLCKLYDLRRHNRGRGAKSQKLNISHDFFCIELKLSAVDTLITKFHMPTVIFPWQHNGLQALSIQTGKSEFSSFKKCYLLLLFAFVVHSVGVSEYGHYTAQAQESLLNSGATNKAVFIFGR